MGFSVDEFLHTLRTEGKNQTCDEDSEFFNNQVDLPIFYDEDLYRKGQQFYHKHLFAMNMSKLFGLISLLSIPESTEILMYTKMSDSDMKAYKRYGATLLHVNVWYDEDFKPGSRLWTSIKTVRKMHNNASKRCSKALSRRITQHDMALTQFAFFGFALIRKEKIGIHYSTPTDWKAFLHLWRVVGYLFGIEDRFNVCRESVEETTAICTKFMQVIFLPGMERRDENFLKMASYLLNGLWYVNTNIHEQVFMNLCYNALMDTAHNGTKEQIQYVPLTSAMEKHFIKISTGIKLLNYAFWRWFVNSILRVSFWLIQVFPFTAFYRFGINNSYVSIQKS